MKVYIEYRDFGVLANAYSVTLASEDNSYGIKSLDGTVLVLSGATVDNPSTGLYEYEYDFPLNTVFRVSWKVIATPTSAPKYVVQEVGPFSDTASTLRAVADFRGTFRQGTRGAVFIRITDINGEPQDADSITVSISNGIETPAEGAPEKINVGYYAFDWEVSPTQEPGPYIVTWSYTVNGQLMNSIQEIVVAKSEEQTTMAWYGGRIQEMRESLNILIQTVQNIPMYGEPGKPSKDFKTYRFTKGNWNQSPGCHIYRNDIPIIGGCTVNYFKGTVTFDVAQTEADRITADYNFRWFSDQELDRFLSDAVHILNYSPAVTRYNIGNLEERFIPLVLYGAAIGAIRRLMMDLIVEEPQLYFGGPDGSDKAYQRLEALKKNFEETWNDGLEKKKYGPYKGLTRMVVTPEFALPGGRSRWFRYLYSNGV